MLRRRMQKRRELRAEITNDMLLLFSDRSFSSHFSDDTIRSVRSRSHPPPLFQDSVSFSL